MSKKRHEVSDEQWGQLEPLLPSQKPKIGRTNLDHRMVINGIIWILRTGAPWGDLPERYGKWQTVASRFYRWQKSGVWDRILTELQQMKDATGLGSALRGWQRDPGAPPCRRSKKSSPETAALERSQGGFSTKIHLRAEGRGNLMTFLLTLGERHELSVAETLVELVDCLADCFFHLFLIPYR